MWTTIIENVYALYVGLPLALLVIVYNINGPIKHSEGYLLHNQVTHARLLPVESKHAFTYPTLSFLVSLDALEKGRLNLLGGLVFGYGGLWGRLLGIRPDPYLVPGKETIRLKLENVLSRQGLPPDKLRDVWMMTMPSYLGFEGINPLTVYFCYKPDNILWLTVLEVHNTFGENHVYVLELGKNEDEKPASPFDHQWSFRRAFHVSPFNDRSGFYVVSIRRPSHAPSEHSSTTSCPMPSVRVHLHLDNPLNPNIPGELKLTALLRPTSASRVSTTSLLKSILAAPFALLLSMPRIVYQAWSLHYRKSLNVYIRPEPKPAWGSSAGGVKWLSEGMFETYAKKVNERFLRRWVDELGVAVKLVPGDPSLPETLITPRNGEVKETLTISYLSSKFFTVLFSSPSAAHALLMGSESEGLFTVSSESLFKTVYTGPAVGSTRCRRQRLRAKPVPSCIELAVPPRHPFDHAALASAWWSFAVLWLLQAMDDIEAFIFRLVKARTVPGNEPWYREQWERAAFVEKRPVSHPMGSVRQES